MNRFWMARIPHTRIEINWLLLLVVLIAFVYFANPWWRGLIAFAVMIGVGVLLNCYAWKLLTWLLDGKKRRPGESWEELHFRIARESDEMASFRDYRYKKYGLRYSIDNYRYVRLDCGHVIWECFPKAMPEPGESFWCWGHRKHGPAQEQTIESVSIWLPPEETKGVLLKG